jgi:hypothetical protein
MDQQPPPRGSRNDADGNEKTGISNRESAEQERAERAAHPPVDTSSPPPQDAGADVGERGSADNSGRQTAHKAGSRSIAQKEAESRYPDRSMPPSRKVAGAFGKEPEASPQGDEPE